MTEPQKPSDKEEPQEVPTAEPAPPEAPVDADKLWQFSEPHFDVEFRNSGDEFNTQYVSIVDDRGNNVQVDPETFDAMTAAWAKYRKASR